MSCPFCDSREVELVSAWGGQLMVSQMRCRACGAYFEAVREDLAPRAGGAEEAGPR
jgi:transcription elongation factor Elf1